MQDLGVVRVNNAGQCEKRTSTNETRPKGTDLSVEEKQRLDWNIWPFFHSATAAAADATSLQPLSELETVTRN